MGHFIIGLSILIPIFYLTDGKFNKKVAVIFLLNNWIGPDHGQIFSKLLGLEDLIGIDFHYFIPFMVWAIPLSYCYSYISRFSVKKTDRFFTIQDDGKRDVNWQNAYLLCLSGGLLHTITDAIFRHETYNSTIKMLDNVIQPTLGDLYGLSSIGMDVGVAHVLLTYILAILVVFILMYLWDKDLKSVLLFFIIYVIAVLAITLSFASEEYDTAVVILSLTFIVTPLMLLFYVDKSVRNNPTSIKENPRIEPEVGLKIIGLISLLLSTALFLFGLFVILNPSMLESLEVGELFIIAVAALVCSIAGVMVLGSIGLFLKKNLGRQIVMFATLIMLLLIVPLIIFFYLNQENVRELFKKEIRSEINHG